MKTDCRHCEALLLDFSYDEIDDADRELVTAHLQDCADCAAALDAMQQVRQLAALHHLAPPPLSMDAAILDMADQMLQPAKDDRPTPATTTPSLLQKIQAALLRPAVATMGVAAIAAAALLLGHRGEMPSALPTQPIAEDIDRTPAPRSAASDTPERAPLASPYDAAPEPTPADEGASLSMTRGMDAPHKRKQGRRLHATPPVDQPTAARQPSADASATGGAAKRALAMPADNAAVRSAPIEEAAAEETAAAPMREMAMPAPQVGFAAPPPTQGATPDLVASPKVSAPRAATPPPDTALASGMAAYNRGNCNAAIADFQRALQDAATPSADVPVAHHHIARCEARMGRCANATTHFNIVLQRHRHYAERAAVLHEAAECQRRLGNPSQERALLEELRTFPAWRTRADARLQELDAPR